MEPLLWLIPTTPEGHPRLWWSHPHQPPWLLSQYSQVLGSASETFGSVLWALGSQIVISPGQSPRLRGLVLHVYEIVWDSWSAFEDASKKNWFWCAIERQFQDGYFCLMPYSTNLENLCLRDVGSVCCQGVALGGKPIFIYCILSRMICFWQLSETVSRDDLPKYSHSFSSCVEMHC